MEIEKPTISNAEIADQLKQLGKYFEEKDDIYRSKALINSSIRVRKFPEQITNPKVQLKGVQGIGSGSIKRIEELLETGKLAELEKIKSEIMEIEPPMQISPNASIVEILREIYGVGPKTAEKFIGKGIRSIEDLRAAYEKKEIKLTKNQAIGLKYYNDFKQRIPRTEVTKVGERILDLNEELDEDNVGAIVGSYRRGKETSGDIDILISNVDNDNYLPDIVEKLKSEKLLEYTLALGEVSFHGTYISDSGIMRKIDIRFVPYESYPTALLHSTGSDNFNVLLRKRALSKGLTLSEHGLFNVDTGERIPINSEEDVFKALDMEYIPPEKRDIVQ